MPLVEFLQDFQGVETNENFYKKGQRVDVSDHMAGVLVFAKRAIIVAGSVNDSAPQQMSEDVLPEPEEKPTMFRNRKTARGAK